MTKKSAGPHFNTINWLSGNRVKNCVWRHRIREIRQNLRILTSHATWTRFVNDRLIVSRCGFELLIFWALFDENWSITPLNNHPHLFCVHRENGWIYYPQQNSMTLIRLKSTKIFLYHENVFLIIFILPFIFSLVVTMASPFLKTADQ